MILVDTSIWIDHFRKSEAILSERLLERKILSHPFTIGELACGNLVNRKQVLDRFADLPQAPVASDDEVLRLIEIHRLMGRGIGYIDAHLLASTALSNNTRLWTRDLRLRSIAEELELCFHEPGQS